MSNCFPNYKCKPLMYATTPVYLRWLRNKLIYQIVVSILPFMRACVACDRNLLRKLISWLYNVAL